MRARELSVLVSASAAASICGCQLLGGGSIADKAARTERMQCEAATTQEDLRVLQTTPVLEVEGRYAYHESGAGHVTATRIVLRPPPGVSSARMTRILQCHSARVVLGRPEGVALPNDPYVLPETWLDIDVKEEEGNYVAIVSADTVAENLRVLQRAQAFAAAQRAAPPSPPM
jgi:hypothetical protein